MSPRKLPSALAPPKRRRWAEDEDEEGREREEGMEGLKEGTRLKEQAKREEGGGRWGRRRGGGRCT